MAASLLPGIKHDWLYGGLVRLQRLLVELWEVEALWHILGLAEDLVALDTCTAELKRLGFARAFVRINLSRPLRSRLLIDGPNGPQWQRFI